MVAALIITTGQEFGRLKIEREIQAPVGAKGRVFRVRCECGTILDVELRRLRSNNVRSCGCLRRDRMAKGNIQSTHKLTRHALYPTWNGMMQRCYNSKHDAYKNYGGRGIKVCKAWHDVKNFIEWAESRWKNGLKLDREKNNQDYSPSNCRFVTTGVNNNNRRSNRRISIYGENLTVADAYRKFPATVSYVCIRKRLDAGMTPEQAFETPSRQKGDE